MIIEDGTGNGHKAKVTSENQLFVTAITATVEHHTNHSLGAAYHVLFTQNPTSTNDCIFFMENTSETDIVLEGISLSVDAPTQIYIQSGDIGTRTGATTLTPANCNFGSGQTAIGTFQKGAQLYDDPTATGGIEIDRYIFLGASGTDTTHINFPQDLIMPKGSTMTLWTSADVTVTCTLYFNYHDKGLG